MPYKLYSYIAKKFIYNFIFTFVFVSFAILLINSIENVKRFYIRNVDISTIIKITMLKYPFLIDQIFPFLIFISSILTFLKLTRNSELMVIRSAGLSAWQFIVPVMFSSFLIGILSILVINPIVAISLTKYERLANKFIDRSHNSILSISKSGLWLKEEAKDDIPARILRARHISTNEMILHDVMIFNLSADHKFISRIDAKSAILDGKKWILKDVRINSVNEPEIFHKIYKLKTTIVIKALQNSFSKPEMLPFWDFLSFIDMLDAAGFSALNHKIYFGKLLLRPFFLTSMVLVSIIFALRLPRLGNNSIVLCLGIFFGFVIYFMTDVIEALGLSGGINPYLSITLPLAITLMIGSLLILHFEDG